jgi:putative multicomponent Na+:H+ antiporter subunit B
MTDGMDAYVYVIVALLPLAALMLTVQVNPYHALVIRGILGAVAALVYAVLGAADVALTEALVGTMLAITLYAVAVRSSLVMRLGVLKDHRLDLEKILDPEKIIEHHHLTQLVAEVRAVAHKHHLRLELVSYPDLQSLNQALIEKEVHATCTPLHCEEQTANRSENESPFYQTATRIRRLYDILQTELSSPAIGLTYVTTSDLTTTNAGGKH